MNNLMEINMFYIKYNLLPNLVAFGLAYSYYSDIKLKYSLSDYYNRIVTFFNVYQIELKDEYRLINSILLNKYSLLIINTDTLELMRIKK